MRNSLQSILEDYPDISDFKDKIACAWYYIDEIVGSSSILPYDHRCDYFYYWLGDLISNKLKMNSGSFPTVMNLIYGKLPKKKNARECNLIYSNIKKEQFDNMKKIYDHSQDYSTIKQRLEQSGSRCTEELKQYMEVIYSTYDTVQKECDGKSDGPCNSFEQKYKDSCSRKFAQLSCSEGISAATAAVSSILGVAALPLTTFFLYKYDLLPSAIKNTFFRGGGRGSTNNNRRKGRSTSRNEFDTLTSMDGASTFDSTDLSTAYSAAAYSTEDSTVYGGRPPSRGKEGRTNNRRPGNMKNISYQ
ncbi:Variable surface protein Vir7-like protein, partial [Plasmodium coatneyi]